jgi:integrase
VEGHSRPLADLADRDLILDMLDAISCKLDGTPAAANTVARKRAVLSNVLDYGVGRGLAASPLPAAAKVWTAPKTTEGAVDPRVVVNRHQAEQLLTAVSYQGRIGPKLVAFFACLYYAGTRPGEAVELRADLNLDLPEDDDWGTLYLHGNAPTVGAGWSRSGRRRDPRQLKHRAQGEVRPVPCHPALTRYLLRHIAEFGTAPDGRLFRGERGGDLSESVYQRARLLAFTPAVAVSPLAGRPYDLRHACLSTWLNAGVDPTQVAEWAGNSVEVLLRVYAKCIHGRDRINRKLIEDALRDDDQDGEGR